MKSLKIVIYAIAMVLMSTILFACASINYIPKVQRTAILDFTPYQKQGFLITTESYLGKYESVGILSCVMRPEATLITNETSGGNITQKWVVGELNVKDIMEMAFKKATEMGGNAVINFKFLPNNQTYVEGLPVTKPLTVEGIEITGFIIKRID